MSKQRSAAAPASSCDAAGGTPDWTPVARVLEHDPDAVLLLDATLRCRWANARARAALVRRGGTLVGRPVAELVTPLGVTLIDAAVRGALTEGRIQAVPRLITRLGRCYELHATPLDGAVVAHLRDVTEQARAESALRASEASYRTLLDQLGDGIAVVDARGDGRLVVTNDRLAEMTGFTRKELHAMRVLDLVLDGPEDPGERVARLSKGETLRSRRRLRRKEGPPLTTEISTRMVGTRIQAVLHDVSERETFEEHRRSVQKLEALGLLAGSVAHDFNNFLLAIQSNVELALGGIGAGAHGEAAAIHTELEEILRVAQRAARLTRQLLTFSRTQAPQPSTFPLIDAVTGIEPMLRRLVEPSVRLAVRTPSHAGQVRADLGQLEQVVMNLVMNARDAMRDGGEVAVGVRTVSVAAPRRVGLTGQMVPAGEYVVLSVTDAGTGMTREVAVRAFEPLFSTKAAGAGTGLGLWTVHAIVHQADGYVTVESEPGRGSTFEVWLPAIPGHGRRGATGDAAAARAVRSRAPRSA